MRLFIAIQVPEYVKVGAASLKDKLSQAGLDIKWVEYENYHLTLKFLGEVDKTRIVKVKEKLEEAAQGSAPFNLAVSNPGCFPNWKRPRVLYLGISGQNNMALALGNRIDARLSEMGFKPDNRRHFHLTLGRFRSERNIEKLLHITENMPEVIDKRAFQVTQFYLMESQLLKKGPVYKVVETMKIG